MYSSRALSTAVLSCYAIFTFTVPYIYPESCSRTARKKLALARAIKSWTRRPSCVPGYWRVAQTSENQNRDEGARTEKPQKSILPLKVKEKSCNFDLSCFSCALTCFAISTWFDYQVS